MKRTAQQKRKLLRELLAGKEALVAPGIYDGYGARLVQNAGFHSAYMTGNGVSASLLGTPDIGQVDLTLISDHARRVAACIDIPLICDADTGYGGVLNIKRTIEEFEAAGVAAIHLEDQTFPKQCAQFEGARTVLPFDIAVAHIRAAVAAKSDPDFVVIARTDSVGAFGLDEGIRRAKAFIEAGADGVFVELKANPAALEIIGEIKAKLGSATCLYNVDVGGPISSLKASDMKVLGIDIAIHPSLARGVFGYAMQNALDHLKEQQLLSSHTQNMFTSAQYNDSLGLEEIQNWENHVLKSSKA
jgi:2-methylisocitrate lyase-like PEP mutase family enzyme